MRQGGRALGGVAVHYRHRMLPIFAAEEGLADPQQILLRLRVQRAIGMHAGMHEDVVADAALQGKTLQEGEPVRPEAFVQRRSQFQRVLDARVGRQRLKRLLAARSEEHTSELQSLMRHTYAVVRWKKKKH